MDLVLMEAIQTLVSKFSCINAWSTQARSFLYSLSSCIFDLHAGSYLYFIHYSGCELKPKTRSQGNLTYLVAALLVYWLSTTIHLPNVTDWGTHKHPLTLKSCL